MSAIGPIRPCLPLESPLLLCPLPPVRACAPLGYGLAIRCAEPPPPPECPVPCCDLVLPDPLLPFWGYLLHANLRDQRIEPSPAEIRLPPTRPEPFELLPSSAAPPPSEAPDGPALDARDGPPHLGDAPPLPPPIPLAVRPAPERIAPVREPAGRLVDILA